MSLNRQLCKEERLVQRIDMERDELEDLTLSLDDKVDTIPRQTWTYTRNEKHWFLDDLKAALEQAQRYKNHRSTRQNWVTSMHNE